MTKAVNLTSIKIGDQAFGFDVIGKLDISEHHKLDIPERHTPEDNGIIYEFTCKFNIDLPRRPRSKKRRIQKKWLKIATCIYGGLFGITK